MWGGDEEFDDWGDLGEEGTLGGEKQNQTANKDLVDYARKNDTSGVQDVLQREYVDFDFRHKDANGKTALIYAVEHSNQQMLADLFHKIGGQDKRHDVISNQNNHREKTPLMYCKDESMVRVLLSNSWNVNDFDREGNTALIHAAKGGHDKVVDELIRGGAEVGSQNSEGKTALMEVITNDNSVNSKAKSGPKKDAYDKNLAIVNNLLKDTQSLNVQDKNGNTALIMAVRTGQKKVVQNLLEKGADVSIQNKQGETALTIAAVGDSKDTVKLLLKTEQSLDNVRDALEEAQRKHNVKPSKYSIFGSEGQQIVNLLNEKHQSLAKDNAKKNQKVENPSGDELHQWENKHNRPSSAGDVGEFVHDSKPSSHAPSASPGIPWDGYDDDPFFGDLDAQKATEGVSNIIPPRDAEQGVKPMTKEEIYRLGMMVFNGERLRVEDVDKIVVQFDEKQSAGGAKKPEQSPLSSDLAAWEKKTGRDNTPDKVDEMRNSLAVERNVPTSRNLNPNNTPNILNKKNEKGRG